MAKQSDNRVYAPLFRTLTANEIDCRVATINENGISLLLYKDARCDMEILDETIGALNWQRRHTRDNANCIVLIYDQDRAEWVSKEDTGTESYTEKEKGLASDSFKRACVNWGIGRELYTAPFIWIDKSKVQLKPNPKDKSKLITYDKFKVIAIEYDDRRQIKVLSIANAKTGEIVYTFGKSMNKPQSETIYTQEKITDIWSDLEERNQAIAEIKRLLLAANKEEIAFLDHLGIEDITHISKPQYEEWREKLKGAAEK